MHKPRENFFLAALAAGLIIVGAAAFVVQPGLASGAPAVSQKAGFGPLASLSAERPL